MRKKYSFRPLRRISDKKMFFGVYIEFIPEDEEDVVNNNMWLVIDKVSYIVVDCVQDEWVVDIDTEGELDPDWTYVSYPRIDARYATNIISRLTNIAETFSQEIWQETQNMLSAENNLSSESTSEEIQRKVIEDRQTDAYRYENFVLRKYRRILTDKIVRVDVPEISNNAETRYYVAVNDVYIDDKDGMPALGFSGHTISVKMSDSGYSFGFYEGVRENKDNVMIFAGYLDELMLMDKNRIQQLFFRVVEDASQIIPDVSAAYGTSIVRLRNFFESIFKTRNKSIDEMLPN